MQNTIDRKELDKLLARVDLVSLIEQRSPVRLGRAAGTGEKRTVKGACPFCGGTDRFAVFVNDTPQRYYCGIHGNGCNQTGDAIQFLREYEHMTFAQALAAITGDTGAILAVPAQANRNADIPQWQSELWQRRAAQFCKDAQERLWIEEGRQVLAYIQARGLTDETIKKAHIGMVMYKGANIARNEHGAVPCLVIPWFDSKSGKYWRVTLRDIRPGVDPKRRYENIAGSSNTGLYLSDALRFARPVFMVEGEIDALTIAQEAGDLVTVVATGSTGGGRLPSWAVKLASKPNVFIAFDSEEKAEESAAYWLGVLSNAQRWYSPIGKDANAMHTQGGDIRLWVQAALSVPDPSGEAKITQHTQQTQQSYIPMCPDCNTIIQVGWNGERYIHYTCGRFLS